MSIRVSGKHMDIGESLQGHIETETHNCLAHYFHEIPDVHVTLSKDHHLFKADLSVHLSRNFTAHCHAQDDDPYRSVNHALHKLSTLAKKYKSRIKDHKRHKDADLDPSRVQQYVIKPHEEDVIEEKPIIIAEMGVDISTLSVAEAVMRLEMSGEPMVIFKNSGTLHLNLVHWRNDKHIGWMDLGQ